jgi:hypothetical protein
VENLFIHLLKNRAYLDPGSGSILLQILIGAILGLGFIVRAFWGRIKGFFQRSDGTESLTDEDE